MSTIAIGIDLGTTNSCVGWFDQTRGVVEICPDEYGKRTLPSYVAFCENEQLIGEAAVRQQSRNPENTIYESKRFIGKTFNETLAQQNHYPFRTINIGDDNVNFLVQYHNEDRVFCPEEIGALILEKMRVIAASHTGKTVQYAVITVPAYFNDSQRQATRDAGRIAGLDVIRIINEPTAAAIAYGLDRKAASQSDVTVLVFDLGGGTFDTSILTVTRDGVFEVRAISGDTYLGGADFDQRLVHYVQEAYQKKYNCPFNSTNHKMQQRLRKACEKTKCELSGVQRVDIELEGSGPNGEDFLISVSRAQFNEMCDDLFRKCMDLVRLTLKDANLTCVDINDIVLVGGSTRIPRIQELLSAEFDGKELCKSINPDEAVAHGAAIQAAVLAAALDVDAPSQSTVPDIILLDVCPLSLGVETTGGLMSALIPRNTIVPVKRSRLYSTTEDNQDTVVINVFEGERANVIDNRKLGDFELSCLPALPRGAPKIRVSFELDADGIFTVSAEDESESTTLTDTTASRKAKHVLTIQNNKGRLSEEEVKKYVHDAEQNSIRDGLFTKAIRLKTNFENLLYGVRRTFTETSADILEKHADPEVVKLVIDVVNDQFEWLQAIKDSDPLEELIAELERRSDWVENDVARSVVDAVNLKIQESTTVKKE